MALVQSPIASVCEAMTQGVMAQVATMDEETLRALADILRALATGCDRELAQRALARSAPAGTA